jgi:DNA-binding LytR/AlgR family response regulator
MITAVAIDDEPLALQVIKEYCSKIDFVDLRATFTRTGKALEFIHENKVDLLFLDIEMPLISGIDFYKRVPLTTVVIFTTAYSQYAVDSYNLNAIDYLLKPFDFSRLRKAVEKAKDHFQLQTFKKNVESDHLSIKVDYGVKKIALADIHYIEGQDNYLKIHLDDGKFYMIRMALKSMIQQLPESQFLRVHKSYIISKKKVTAYKNRSIFLGELEIPTSGIYLADVNRIFASESKA